MKYRLAERVLSRPSYIPAHCKHCLVRQLWANRVPAAQMIHDYVGDARHAQASADFVVGGCDYCLHPDPVAAGGRTGQSYDGSC